MMVEERKDSELNEIEARNKRKYVVRMRNVAMMVLRSWRGRGCGPCVEVEVVDLKVCLIRPLLHSRLDKSSLL